MNAQDIGSAIKDFILTEFLPDESPDSIDKSTSLISGGVLNSLATLQLVTFLEDTFDISIKAREVGIDYMDTIADIESLVISKQKS